MIPLLLWLFAPIAPKTGHSVASATITVTGIVLSTETIVSSDTVKAEEKR